jgi:hypothetical protein
MPLSRYAVCVFLVSASIGVLVGLGGSRVLSPDLPPAEPVAGLVPDIKEPPHASARQATRNLPNRNVRVILPGPVPLRSASGVANTEKATALTTESGRDRATSNVVSSAEDPSVPVEARSPATLAAGTSRQAATNKRCDLACGKYRSFRASDCSYQPFRGPRKICETAQPQPPGSEAFAFVPTSRISCDVQWCSRQYRSFDYASCTYQPYGGGPRKRCEPNGRN